jgi:hypothetical protein
VDRVPPAERSCVLVVGDDPATHAFLLHKRSSDTRADRMLEGAWFT